MNARQQQPGKQEKDNQASHNSLQQHDLERIQPPLPLGNVADQPQQVLEKQPVHRLRYVLRVRPHQDRRVLLRVRAWPEVVRRPGCYLMWRVGGCPDPVHGIVGLRCAYFAAEHLEGLRLVEVDVEGWGLGWSC